MSDTITNELYTTKYNDTINIELGLGQEYIVNGKSGGNDILRIICDSDFDFENFKISNGTDSETGNYNRDILIEYTNPETSQTDKITILNYKKQWWTSPNSIKHFEIVDKNSGESRKYLLKDFVPSVESFIYEKKGYVIKKGSEYSDNLRGNDELDYTLNGIKYDKLYGGDGNDTINAFWGNDYLDGENGSDKLYGGEGNDTIKAGTDKTKNGVYYENFIDGGLDNDKLYAGGGKDTFYFGENFGKDSVYFANQDDEIYFENQCFYDLEFNKVGNNLVIKKYNDDNTVTLSNYFKTTKDKTLDKIITYDQISESDEENFVYVEHSIKKEARININSTGKINGTSFSDIISTTEEKVTKDTVNAGDGYDEIYTYGGNDTINGGDGKDYIYAGAGNDTINGGNGDDDIYAGEGNDKITGGTGTNTITYYGGDGNDTIYLTKGETLIIDYLNDWIVDEELNLEIYEKGNDLIITNKFNEEFEDEEGILHNDEIVDTITIKNFAKNIAKKVTFNINEECKIEDLYAYVYEQGCGGRGTKKDDNFILTLGNGETSEIIGNSGGADTIKLMFDEGKENGEFTYLQVIIDEKPTKDLAITYTNADKTDTVIIKDYFNYDKKGNLITKSSVKYVEIGNDKLLLSDMISSNNFDIKTDKTNTSYTGTMFTDDITGTDKTNKIYANAGNDIINGLGGDDYLDGGEGNDYIDGGAGKDTIVGENGDDIIKGGKGNDEITGGKGSNTIIYNKGDGSDTIYYTKGEKLTINYYDNSCTLDSSNFNFYEQDNKLIIVREYDNTFDAITIQNFDMNNLEDELILNVNPIFDENGLLTNSDYSYYSLLEGVVKSTKGNDTLEITLGEGKEYKIKANSGGTDTLKIEYDNFSRDNISASPMNNNGIPTKDLLIEYRECNEYGEVFTDRIIIKNYFTKAQEMCSSTKSSIKYIEFGDKKYLLTDIITQTAIACDFKGKYVKQTGTNFSDNISGWEAQFNQHLQKYGFNGNDKIYAKDGNDYVEGRDGDDYIDGGNGSDKLYGGTGDDTIKAGDDKSKNGVYYENFIDGGSGDDKLYAGGGKDTFFFGETSGDDIIYSATSEDVLTFDSSYDFRDFDYEKDGNNLVMNTSQNSSVELSNYFKSKDGNVIDKIIVNGTEYSIMDNFHFEIAGSDKKDTIISNIGTNTITAGLGDDYIDATKGKNTIIINKGDGDDTILVGTNGGTNIEFNTPENIGYNLSFAKVGNNLEITRSYYYKNDFSTEPDNIPTETTILKNYFKTDKNGNYIQPNVSINGKELSEIFDAEINPSWVLVNGSLNKANKIDLRKYDDFTFNVYGGNKNDKIYLGAGNHHIGSGAGNDDVVVNNDGKNTYYYDSGSDEYDSLGNSSDDYMVYFSSKTNLEIEDHGGVDTLNITIDSMSSISNDDICFCFDIRKNGTFAGEPNTETDRMYIFSKDTLTYENVMREIRGKDMQGVIEIENFLKVNTNYVNNDFLAYGAIEEIRVDSNMLEGIDISGSIQEIAANVVNWLNSSNNTRGWDSSMEVFASGNKEAIESLIGAFTTDITWTPLNNY